MAYQDTTQRNRPAAGISIIVFGLFMFSFQDIIIKAFSDQYSVLQIAFIRCTVALIPILIAVFITAGARGLVAHEPRLLLLRGLFGFLSYMGYYLAIAALPLAEVVTIVFSAPIFITLLSVLLLREKVGAKRWSAILVGFLGVVVVVGPSGQIADLAVILALLATLTYALMSIVTRYVGGSDTPWTMSLYSVVVFILGSVVASLLVAVFEPALNTESPSLQFLLRPWVVPAATDLLLMIVIGLNWAVGSYCLAKAYAVAPVSVVAPFEYTYIIWAVLFGFLIWSEVPAVTTFIGLALLISSSLYILRRELRTRGQRIEREFAPRPVNYARQADDPPVTAAGG
ncbi:MAG: DMT family transporter [Gammaproteobacteria bacterium]|nr:DMT family transporter [Gammaproteobacteria bacterium]